MTVASPIPPSNPLDHERAPESEPDDELARIWRAIEAVNDSIAELRRVGGMPQPELIVTRAEACSCDEAIELRTEVRRLKSELRTQQADREALVEQARLAQSQRGDAVAALKAYEDALEQGRAFWNQVDEGHPLREQLDAANALLEECANGSRAPNLTERVRAHLAGQAAARRADGEQRVLDASHLILDSSLRRIREVEGGCLGDWAEAELARREAAKQ